MRNGSKTCWNLVEKAQMPLMQVIFGSTTQYCSDASFFAPVFFYYISALAQETIALNLVGEKVLGVDDAEVVHLFRDHSYSATDHKSEKNVSHIVLMWDCIVSLLNGYF